MISHKHKFILICPEKTGSTSAADVLLKYSDYKNINQQGKDLYDFIDEFSDMKPWMKKHGSKHARYRLVVKRLAEKNIDHTQYYTAGMIRNPYDRIISYWKWSLYSKKTLIEFLSEKNIPTLLDFFSINSKVEVNNFIRYENLQEDFNSFCNQIGIPSEELPHKNKSKRKHYTEYYDDETRKIVAEKYAKDIEYFGYKY